MAAHPLYRQATQGFQVVAMDHHETGFKSGALKIEGHGAVPSLGAGAVMLMLPYSSGAGGLASLPAGWRAV